jgi:hypothetical protein
MGQNRRWQPRPGGRLISAVPPEADFPLLSAVTAAIIGMIRLVLAMLDDRFMIDLTFDARRSRIASGAGTALSPDT